MNDMNAQAQTRRATDKAQMAFENDCEAHRLLALIDRQLRADPACAGRFDPRLVHQLRRCVDMRRTLASQGVVIE